MGTTGSRGGKIGEQGRAFRVADEGFVLPPVRCTQLKRAENPKLEQGAVLQHVPDITAAVTRASRGGESQRLFSQTYGPPGRAQADQITTSDPRFVAVEPSANSAGGAGDVRIVGDDPEMVVLEVTARRPARLRNHPEGPRCSRNERGRAAVEVPTLRSRSDRAARRRRRAGARALPRLQPRPADRRLRSGRDPYWCRGGVAFSAQR